MDQHYTVSRLEYDGAMRAINGLAGLAERVGLSTGDIDPDAVLETARRTTGLDDTGDPSFLPFFERFLAVCDSYPVTPLARVGMRSTALAGLQNRLRVQDYVRRHPEATRVPVERPVFIVGFPRTGTTLIQNLLALEPGARALQFWELLNPVPVSDDALADRRSRIATAERVLRVARIAAPETPIVHDVRATTPEECWYLFANSFAVLNWDLQSGFSRWGDWLLAQDLRGAYREYRRTLQVMAHWKTTGRFILKCPEHLWFLDALLDVFPDACIVWTHRDPVSVLPSYCSMMSLTWRTWWGHIDGSRVGRHLSERLAQGIDRAMRVRDRVGAERFYDLAFDDLVADPAAAVRDIRQHFGLPHGSRADRAVRDYLARPRRDRPGRHRYAAEQWGLDDRVIRRRFAYYIERFGLGDAARPPDSTRLSPPRGRRTAPGDRPGPRAPEWSPPSGL